MYQERNEITDRYSTPKTTDGWVQMVAADGNSYQQGNNQQKYGQDLKSTQSYIDKRFGQLQITGSQDGAAGECQGSGAQSPFQPRETDAATIERETHATVEQQNRDLDAGYQFVKGLYGTNGATITDSQITAALDRPNLRADQARGLRSLQASLEQMGTDTQLTQSTVDQIKNQQAAATWLQAENDSPALRLEMHNARDAYYKFALKAGPSILGVGPGPQYLMLDEINNQLQKGGLSAQHQEGLEFLKRNYNELDLGDDKAGILSPAIDSWTPDWR